MPISRREFSKLFAVGAIVLGGLKLVSQIPDNARAKIVRPPGAVNEPYFNLLCIRCGICLEVCPTKAIALTGFEDGLASVNTPKIESHRGACEFFRGRCEETMLCSKYCPTSALQIVNKEQVKLGTVELDSRICIAFEGKECLICYEMCPMTEAISVAEGLTPVFHKEKCVGCGTCVNICPTNPKALTLKTEGSKRTKWSR